MQELVTARFKGIFEEPLLRDLLECGEIREFREGEVIMDYGKYIRAMPIILSGTVKVYRLDKSGKEILLYYLSATDSCSMAYSCCMHARKSEVKAIAEEDGQLITIPHAKLDEWICTYPSWRSYIFDGFMQRFNELLQSIDLIAFGHLDQRVKNYLLDKSRHAHSSVIKVSHQQIASDLGTTRVVISRILKQFENMHQLILYRNEIKLLRPFFGEEAKAPTV
ncbi:MAG: Crp/Fnr family transcriptional regulator [Chitinophagales bacterium]|nr:Crp/Fnr family transcriptional regulator [Chitinophagales bacterium]MDW8393827.1 Crp/Fnr family transcriptional regulator [Chitinophagales bacterium]